MFTWRIPGSPPAPPNFPVKFWVLNIKEKYAEQVCTLFLRKVVFEVGCSFRHTQETHHISLFTLERRATGGGGGRRWSNCLTDWFLIVTFSCIHVTHMGQNFLTVWEFYPQAMITHRKRKRNRKQTNKNWLVKNIP